MRSFQQWLEDTGEVWPKANGPEYAARGVGSKIESNDKKRLVPCQNCKSPEAAFGVSKQKAKKVLA